jgi:hypothetical protein
MALASYPASRFLLALLVASTVPPRTCISFVLQPVVVHRNGIIPSQCSRVGSKRRVGLLGARGGVAGGGGGNNDFSGMASRAGRKSNKSRASGSKDRIGMQANLKKSDAAEKEDVALKKQGEGPVDEVVAESSSDGQSEGVGQRKEKASDSKTKFARGDVEATGGTFWIEYTMRVLLDSPTAAPFVPPTQVSKPNHNPNKKDDVPSRGTDRIPISSRL